jgi:uncharacterized protein (TIGR03118 family)
MQIRIDGTARAKSRWTDFRALFREGWYCGTRLRAERTPHRMTRRRFPWLIALLAVISSALALTQAALASGPANTRPEERQFVQTNLVSDIPGLATITDSSLKNPWGVSHLATSPFWVSNQITNTSTLYAVTGQTTVTKVPLTVTIPTTAAGPQGPTGQVSNSNPSSFVLPDGSSALFIFADLNGTISAWNRGEGTAATVVATVPGAIYTGLAINAAQTRLYAANAVSGHIDVFDSSFNQVNMPSTAFVDPRKPAGLVPFNVQDIGGRLYVAYAPAGRPAQVSAPLGAGAVAIFDEDGNFIKQLVSGSRLAAPWGIAVAPAGFGKFSHAVLVGNFSNLHSEINAFNPANGALRGTLTINTGTAAPGGLWFIGFGQGGNNGSPNTLYFTDGINREADGLFGAFTFRP